MRQGKVRGDLAKKNKYKAFILRGSSLKKYRKKIPCLRETRDFPCMVNTTYVLCFEPILWHAFVRNPKGVKLCLRNPKAKFATLLTNSLQDSQGQVGGCVS